MSFVVCRLVSAPIIEAAEIVEKLSMRDDKTLRLTLFSLQKFIRVSLFCPVYVPCRCSLGFRKSNLRTSFYREMD